MYLQIPVKRLGKQHNDDDDVDDDSDDDDDDQGVSANFNQQIW